MINRRIILSFLSDNFSKEDVRVCESEIQANTPFAPDKKFHLGISLAPEKIGLWNDFKTRQSGSFYKLVSLITGRDIEESKMYLIEKYYDLIDSFESISEDPKLKEKLISKGYLKINIPRGIDLIFKGGRQSSMSVGPYIKFLESKGVSRELIEERRIMYGYDGAYAGYVVIPFYDDKMNLIYWVGRNIKEKRYKNAPNNIAGGKASGIGYNINTEEQDVVVVEGVFDAMKLGNCGIAGLGAAMTDAQVDMLFKKPRKRIVVAMDNYIKDYQYNDRKDEYVSAGKEGTKETVRKINERIEQSNLKTKLYTFNWESPEFRNYKDFCRCPFDIDFEMLIKNSDEYNEETSDMKIDMLNIMSRPQGEEIF